jgi:predicted acyltransferase
MPVPETTGTPTHPHSAAPPRALALDALRGFAILTMVLSGIVPHGGKLPAWMYHAQTPPPDHKFNAAVPGITWVDLVFPFFLFALGAAIPFALKRRMERGMPWWEALLFIAKRGWLLLVFALFEHQTTPWGLGFDSPIKWWFGLLSFAVMFAAFVRVPDTWPRLANWGIPAVGWAAGITMMFMVKFEDGSGFSLAKSNIILLILAWAAVGGSVAWLFTRGSLFARLGVLGLLMAYRLSVGVPGYVGSVNGWINGLVSPLGGLGMLNYLFIVIPGTIAGEMVLDWLKAKDAAKPGAWGARRMWGIVALMGAFIVVALVGLVPRGVPDAAAGLWARWTPWAAPLMFAMCAAGWPLFRKPGNAPERLLHALYKWGVYWLVLGLLFEPYEGGIKKDSATMSYYFVTSGLAIMMLIGFTILIDIWGRRRWLNGLLVANGQNPMIAYVAGAHLITPVMMLTGLSKALDPLIAGAGAGTAYAFAITFVIALVVAWFTRMKVFWRT